jgi:hypothetical protein
MSDDKRDTVGKISSDLLQKLPESNDPIELQRKMQEDYIDHLISCINDNKQWFDDNFYVLVITKQERLMPNVFRNYFFARQSCPTPDYDQSVYRYKKKEEALEYLWTVPTKDACLHLQDNITRVDKSERELLNFVVEFFDGTLMELSKKLNHEKEDSPLLES